ncbi:DNA polymerase III subunit gamma/tau [Clostridium sp. Cult3]|uniref:DNA polymerase III subunit gamma/tau n=1 Tax=Clostridium sp. Cult3 TaxID=2079004 RepID=UPI001F016F15|nr:DNA polymerase III subunit gamma/tau [Clostridium sp. Cult3]MCF6460143.1 DNA polymerase III subunit gamma/tau [Clostridium sp. Cult3]
MYQALYRQYRPKTFDEVLGQEHITTTLKNQIANGNIGHAYLFSGTKGTGKTSTAKIFARAVNCLSPINGNPCNECEICKGILDESIMDVIEMDAASNNSVDDIRELRDKVVYPPSRARYKIYIIDEVHMLSKGAFNALLKTLEEPPKHLIFILATTESERLPQTILSRCQRFDFKRIINKDIVANMEKICDELSIPVEGRALSLIARNSDGAMRDALSLLDQCISYKDGDLTYEDALDILGIANTELLFSMVRDIREKELEKALLKIDEIVQNGKDIHQFIKDLIYHFRNLLITKTTNNSRDIMDMDEETIQMYLEQSNDMSLDYILKALDILTKSESQAKWATQPRIILEMATIKLVNLEEQVSLEDRVKKLEMMIATGDIGLSKTTDMKTQKKTKVSNKKIEAPKEKVEKEMDSAPIFDDGKELAFETIINQWPKVLKTVRDSRPSTHALLMEGRPVSFVNNKLQIGYKDGYGIHKELISSTENKELVQKIVSSYFSKNINIDFIMDVQQISDDTEDEEDKIQEVKDFFGEDIVEIK